MNPPHIPQLVTGADVGSPLLFLPLVFHVTYTFVTLRLEPHVAVDDFVNAVFDIVLIYDARTF